MRTDSMTVTPEHFKEQMELLCKNHFSVIPLANFVAWRLGRGSPPPPRSVDMQLRRSKAVLEEEFKRPVHFLAWPFGIYDPYLVDRASAAGYQAGFTIECPAATISDPLLTLPRCLVSDNDVGRRFLELLDSAIRRARK